MPHWLRRLLSRNKKPQRPKPIRKGPLGRPIRSTDFKRMKKEYDPRLFIRLSDGTVLPFDPTSVNLIRADLKRAFELKKREKQREKLPRIF